MRAIGNRVQCVFVVSMLAVAAAPSCGDDAPQTATLTPDTAAQFAITTDSLPACSKSIDGAVWYVWSANQFVVCKGSTRTWTTINLNGFNAAIRVVPIAPGATCSAGGVTIQFGLDTSRDGT